MRDEISEIHALFEGAPETTEFRKLRKRIVRYTREAIEQYGMIEPGAHDPGAKRQKWLVCLSGGKDSYTLLAVLHELKWRRGPAGVQSGSGAAELSRHRAARVPRTHGRAASHRISGHL